MQGAHKVRGVLSLVAGLMLQANITARSAEPRPQTEYKTAIHAFEQTIRAELDRGIISGVSVALVDDQQIVYANGFGFADKARRRPADQSTIYRAGSISKLFTALAAMQLVEQGKIDLDQPVTRYLSDFRIVNPFAEVSSVTLRQLMCHRSGMVRESPVGSYFDDAEPSMAETVASLASCVLVHPPNTRTKYSNSGVTVVGAAVERVSGEKFVAYQEKHLLTPIGMKSSSFLMNRTLRPRLAKGYLPVADGRGGFREIETPHFELGTIPAGNLYTTAEDLARFLSFLFSRAQTDKWGRSMGSPLSSAGCPRKKSAS
jgi:CubicO group peptidase (beta-lactamase class C family)